MAQRRSRARVGRRLARRIGLDGSRMVVPALLAVVCLAAGAGAIYRGEAQEFVVRRGGSAEEAGGSAQVAEAEEPEGNDGAGEGSAVDAAAATEAFRYVVHVDGAVAMPGVVELTGADVRVFDAVEAAGGLLADADTTSINLAEPLLDGAKIHVPYEEEDLVPAAESAGTPAGQSQTSGATGSGPAVVLVNINTAGSEELQTLTGVGEATARSIIEERERNGPFASVEDIMRVSGIGERKFEKIKDHICV